MFKCARFLAFVTVVSASLVLGAPVFGAECLKVKVLDSVKASGADLVLNGLGIRKATFMAVKVYVAALYLPQKSRDAGRILGAKQPWQLILRFVRDVGASDIRDAFAGFRTPPATSWLLSVRAYTLNARIVTSKRAVRRIQQRSDEGRATGERRGWELDRSSDFSTALLDLDRRKATE
jgi:hypothetical protein